MGWTISHQPVVIRPTGALARLIAHSAQIRSLRRSNAGLAFRLVSDTASHFAAFCLATRRITVLRRTCD